MSINDNDVIRGLYREFNVEVVETSYSATGANRKKQVQELLIRNYD